MRSRLTLGEKGPTAVARLDCPGVVSGVFDFVVDTGSGATMLGWHDAIRGGIDFESLPQVGKPVAGFGGEATDVRAIGRVCFVYLSFDHQLEQVELPEGILVYRPSRRRTKNWKFGPTANVLGRDFLQASGWQLFVDLAHNLAYIEKP
jgi:hypothetical protein